MTLFIELNDSMNHCGTVLIRADAITCLSRGKTGADGKEPTTHVVFPGGHVWVQEPPEEIVAMIEHAETTDG